MPSYPWRFLTLHTLAPDILSDLVNCHLTFSSVLITLDIHLSDLVIAPNSLLSSLLTMPQSLQQSFDSAPVSSATFWQCPSLFSNLLTVPQSLQQPFDSAPVSSATFWQSPQWPSQLPLHIFHKDFVSCSMTFSSMTLSTASWHPLSDLVSCPLALPVTLLNVLDILYDLVYCPVTFSMTLLIYSW